MAIIIQNPHSRSHHIRGWPVLPLRLKATSLPTKSDTQPKAKSAYRSSTRPLPSSKPSLHPIETLNSLSGPPVETKSAFACGVDLDRPLSIISPLDIDDSTIPGTAYSALPSTEDHDHSLSDPEMDDSSDSGSELSVCGTDSSGRLTPFADWDEPEPLTLDEDDLSSLLPSLLLLHVDGHATSVIEPETPRPYASSFSDSFFRSIPNDLKDVVDAASTTHDPYLHAFHVLLGKLPEGEVEPEILVDPYERAWYAQDQICSLSVTITASAWGKDLNRATMVGRFLFWVLEWAHKYASTLENVCISVPDSFPTQNNALFGFSHIPCDRNTSGCDNVKVSVKFNMLTWIGDTNILHSVLARFVPYSLHVLRIRNQALCIDDALLLINRIAKYEIYSLEIGTLSDISNPPSGFIGAEDMMLPLCLPHLDTLKVASSIPMERFFAALTLPESLCKLEFNLSSAKEVEKMVGSLIKSEGVLEDNILFLDIEVEKAFEGMKEAMKRIKEQAAFAYVAFRGEVEEQLKGVN